jgi:hypothetical protein
MEPPHQIQRANLLQLRGLRISSATVPELSLKRDTVGNDAIEPAVKMAATSLSLRTVAKIAKG